MKLKVTLIDGLTKDDYSDEFLAACIKEKSPSAVYAEVTIHGAADGGYDVDCDIYNVKFERIRRITGYLSGSLETWNDAKRAEEKDRVKHSI